MSEKFSNKVESCEGPLDCVMVIQMAISACVFFSDFVDNEMDRNKQTRSIYQMRKKAPNTNHTIIEFCEHNELLFGLFKTRHDRYLHT